MLKLSIAITASLFLSSLSFAKDVTCSIVGEPGTSTLLIEYVDAEPQHLYLKSPMSEDYRRQDLLIESVSLGKGTDQFSAKPKLKAPIDWSLEPNCFKSIGSQWYFVLNFEQDVYSVYLAPLVELENAQCVPPRFRPQEKKLDCSSSL